MSRCSSVDPPQRWRPGVTERSRPQRAGQHRPPERRRSRSNRCNRSAGRARSGSRMSRRAAATRPGVRRAAARSGARLPRPSRIDRSATSSSRSLWVEGRRSPDGSGNGERAIPHHTVTITGGVAGVAEVELLDGQTTLGCHLQQASQRVGAARVAVADGIGPSARRWLPRRCIESGSRRRSVVVATDRC